MPRRLTHPWSGDSQGQETSLAPSIDNQTHVYDTEYSNQHVEISDGNKQQMY